MAMEALRRKHGRPMPSKFNVLAVYNAEVARGLVHTAEWRGAMRRLQAEFDRWAAEECSGCGLVGTCICPRRP